MTEAPLLFKGKLSKITLAPGENEETTCAFSFSVPLRTPAQFKTLQLLGRYPGQTVDLQITGDQLELALD